jgi:hypothetical protein
MVAKLARKSCVQCGRDAKVVIGILSKLARERFRVLFVSAQVPRSPRAHSAASNGPPMFTRSHQHLLA